MTEMIFSDTEFYQRAHKNSDTDLGMDAIHHTLGPNADQAAPGDHTHGDLGGGGEPPLIGEISMWPLPTAPVEGKHLVCNGDTFDSTVYPELATLLGDTFGVHSDNLYYLPDFRTRLPMGKGDTSFFKTIGLNDGRAEGVARGDSHSHSHTHGAGTLATDKGSNTVTRSTGSLSTNAEVHTHNITGATASAVGLANTTASAHAYIVINYIIRAAV